MGSPHPSWPVLHKALSNKNQDKFSKCGIGTAMGKCKIIGQAKA